MDEKHLSWHVIAVEDKYLWRSLIEITHYHINIFLWHIQFVHYMQRRAINGEQSVAQSCMCA